MGHVKENLDLGQLVATITKMVRAGEGVLRGDGQAGVCGEEECGRWIVVRFTGEKNVSDVGLVDSYEWKNMSRVRMGIDRENLLTATAAPFSL